MLLRREVKAPAARASVRRALEEIPEEELGLWQALRACRKRLADEHGVPPYVIFHDATLRAMLEQKPVEPLQLLAISGVGDTKLERFGEAFLDVIREFEYESL